MATLKIQICVLIRNCPQTDISWTIFMIWLARTKMIVYMRRWFTSEGHWWESSSHINNHLCTCLVSFLHTKWCKFLQFVSHHMRVCFPIHLVSHTKPSCVGSEGLHNMRSWKFQPFMSWEMETADWNSFSHCLAVGSRRAFSFHILWLVANYISMIRSHKTEMIWKVSLCPVSYLIVFHVR